MSGSSLDGLDMALCTFEFNGQSLEHWEALACEARPFPENWVRRLRALPAGSARELAVAHAQFGQFLGEQAKAFLEAHTADADAIASHGHTIFHFPESGANVITTDNSDWATNCPEYKVTAVQVEKVSQPSSWQQRHQAFDKLQVNLLKQAQPETEQG